MLNKFFTIVSVAIAVSACSAQVSEPVSESKTSREARYLIGAAEDLNPTLLSGVDEKRLTEDWSYQRSFAWALWDDANHIVKREKADFANWQTWYSKEDLQGIFRAIYSQMSKDERLARSALSEAQIEQGMRTHNIEQFLGPDWNQSGFERWFAKYDTALKQLSLPGMNKVLMNQTALLFFLKNYAAIDRCAKEKAKAKATTGLAQNSPSVCPQLEVPPYAAFLKTAWRRGQDDFAVPYYQTADLLAQFSGEEWQSQGSVVTDSNANTHSPSPSTYRIDTPSGQIFHLTGVHLALKLKGSWFWASLWLDSEKDDAHDDRPDTLVPVWQRYRLCAVNGFQGIAQANSAAPFEREVAAAEKTLDASWCSNPYLEGGLNNQKTNCIGCHQHAGSLWTQDTFNEHLGNDLASLTQEMDVDDASNSDFVWSLFNGPEPFASFISQEIDYFDITTASDSQKD